MRVQCGPCSNLSSLSSLRPALTTGQHIQEVNGGILPKWANHQATVLQVLRQADLERKEQGRRAWVLRVVSEWTCLRILLEHTGASGCRRVLEKAGGRMGAFGLLQEEEMGPIKEAS